MHANFISLVIAATLATPLAAAQIKAALSPAAKQDTALAGFRLAEISIETDAESRVAGVSLRNSEGGPAMVIDITVPPASGETFTVHLPATSLQQSWFVTFIDRHGDTVGPTLNVPITWPPQLVTDKSFVRPELYDSLDGSLASWPAAWKRNVLLASVLLAIAAGATLLIARPMTRLAAITGVVVVAAGAAGLFAARAPTVIRRTIPDPDGGATLHILSARRTLSWRSDTGGVYPLYRTSSHMKSDDSEINIKKGVRMTLTPRQVRYLREPQ